MLSAVATSRTKVSRISAARRDVLITSPKRKTAVPSVLQVRCSYTHFENNRRLLLKGKRIP